jgi:SAM-dependent methyltransferase
LPEFTGERVVPGLVDADLFNEHFARYQLASRWALGRRVLDAGCGSGYGSAELARSANLVTAIDFSQDAIAYAQEHFQLPNLHYLVGDCLALPEGPFDLIVAFEVIEHLAEWQHFLLEAKRALAPGGLFLVSTPNKLYYAESRGQAGNNPFHVHEFEFAEFQTELHKVFANVGMLLQNHVEGVAFANPNNPVFKSKVNAEGVNPEDSHFFLAVCSTEPLPALDGFCWIPGTGNILREREHHIGLLSGEVELKNQWLARQKAELDELLTVVRNLNAQIEERNLWAKSVWAESEQRAVRITALQDELAREQANFANVAAGYEAKVTELEEINRAKTEWALETERRLTQEVQERSEELAQCVALLNRAEHTVIERTLWAQSLEKDLAETNARLAALRATRLVKAGARLKLVPEQ